MSRKKNEAVTRTLTSLKCVTQSLQAFMTKSNGWSNDNKGVVYTKAPVYNALAGLYFLSLSLIEGIHQRWIQYYRLSTLTRNLTADFFASS